MNRDGCVEDIAREPRAPSAGSLFPSPLVGEGGAERSSATGEGFSPQTLISPAEADPSFGASRHLLTQGEKGRA